MNLENGYWKNDTGEIVRAASGYYKDVLTVTCNPGKVTPDGGTSYDITCDHTLGWNHPTFDASSACQGILFY